MLLSDIFNIGFRYEGKVQDFKFEQCEHISPVDEAPFIRRCTKSKGIGLKTCLTHSFTVTYAQNNGHERTKYFSRKSEAEYFRTKEIPLSWLETNYTIETPPVAK